MSTRNMVGMSLRREKLNQDMQAEVMEEDMVAIAAVMAEVTAEDMVALTMAKDLLSLDMDMGAMVDVLLLMVDMVVVMEEDVVDMVEVAMERERLDMAAMEVDMV